MPERPNVRKRFGILRVRTDSRTPKRAPTKCRNSRPVIEGHTTGSSGMYPTRAFASRGCALVSYPPIEIAPPSGHKSPAIVFTIVVFPDPFGPMREKISPDLISNVTPETAVTLPKRFVRFDTVSMIPVYHSSCKSKTRGRPRVDLKSLLPPDKRLHGIANRRVKVVRRRTQNFVRKLDNLYIYLGKIGKFFSA